MQYVLCICETQQNPDSRQTTASVTIPRKKNPPKPREQQCQLNSHPVGLLTACSIAASSALSSSSNRLISSGVIPSSTKCAYSLDTTAGSSPAPTAVPVPADPAPDAGRSVYGVYPGGPSAATTAAPPATATGAINGAVAPPPPDMLLRCAATAAAGESEYVATAAAGEEDARLASFSAAMSSSVRVRETPPVSSYGGIAARFFFLRRKYQMAKAMRSRPRTPQAAPMPAVAPVERPVLLLTLPLVPPLPPSLAVVVGMGAVPRVGLPGEVSEPEPEPRLLRCPCSGRKGS